MNRTSPSSRFVRSAARSLDCRLTGPDVAQKSGWYRNAVVVDGLSSIGDPYAEGDQLRLTDRAWAETRASGITALRDTLLPVGNRAGGWEEFTTNLAEYRNELLANPDRL